MKEEWRDVALLDVSREPGGNARPLSRVIGFIIPVEYRKPPPPVISPRLSYAARAVPRKTEFSFSITSDRITVRVMRKRFISRVIKISLGASRFYVAAKFDFVTSEIRAEWLPLVWRSAEIDWEVVNKTALRSLCILTRNSRACTSRVPACNLRDHVNFVSPVDLSGESANRYMR